MRTLSLVSKISFPPYSRPSKTSKYFTWMKICTWLAGQSWERFLQLISWGRRRCAISRVIWCHICPVCGGWVILCILVLAKGCVGWVILKEELRRMCPCRRNYFWSKEITMVTERLVFGSICFRVLRFEVILASSHNYELPCWLHQPGPAHNSPTA